MIVSVNILHMYTSFHIRTFYQEYMLICDVIATALL